MESLPILEHPCLALTHYLRHLIAIVHSGEEKAHIPTVNDCSGKKIRRCKWLTFCRSTDYVYDQTDVQRAEDKENTVLLDVQSSRWTDPAVELET